MLYGVSANRMTLTRTRKRLTRELAAVEAQLSRL